MGPSEKDQLEMLKTIGFESLDELVTSTVPANIRLEEPMELGSHTSAAMSETEALALLRSMADKNKVLKSLIGQGYNETHTPYVILRNMLENPGWYTAYTPYQAEISQGRLEMLLNYQTLVTELTGMEMANASLLDEATAALDSKAETEVQAAIDRLSENRTVLCVAHRLSTLRSMDRIIVLSQGQTIEEGTFDELLAKDGVFFGLARAQGITA